MSPEAMIQQFINALSLGSIYALLALGLAIVYSILGLLNFAYGELVTVTGYVIFLLMTRNLSFFPAAAVGVLAAGAASLAIERVAFRPLRGASFVTLLFSSFAVSAVIKNLLRQAVSPRPKVIRVPQFLDQVLQVGPLQVGVLPLLTLGVGLVCLLALAAFLQRSDWGLAMRAAAEDFQVTRLMGARANRIIAMSFVISGLVAGVAGVLWVARRGAVSPDMGFIPILKAFIAVVIGGLGSLKGAVMGGFFLAFLEIALMVVLPTHIQPFTDAFALMMVVVILYFRPGGLVSRPAEVIK